MTYASRATRGAALVLAVLAAPAAAQGFDACTGDAPWDATLAALEAEGWAVVPPGAVVPEAAVDRLAWLNVAAYYVDADTGGAQVTRLHEQQRMAVRGLARKVDTDATRARVLTRPDGALRLTRTTTLPGRVEQLCLIALDAPALDAPAPLPEGARALSPDALPDGAPTTLIETRIVLTHESDQ